MTTVSDLDCPGCLRPVGLEDRFCEGCGHDAPHLDGAARLGGLDRDGSGGGCAACGEGLVDREEHCPRCGTRPPAARDHQEVDLGAVAAASDRGRRHARNEDAFAISMAPDGRILAVVCDGVSTTAAPDQASQVAADAGLAALLGTRVADDGDDLEAAYLASRRAVHHVPCGREEERTGAPSSTFLAASVAGSEVRLASMGDCRAFWLPDRGEPTTLTEDDSWAAEVVAAGRRTAEEAREDPRSHSITRWLGRDADPSWMPHRVSFAPGTGGRLVLCSDGLWNYADEAAHIALVTPGGEPALVARSLVEWANAQGGQDNVTVVVVAVGAPGALDGAQQKGHAR